MQCDILVIGGGIAGLSAAARMSALGTVVVLEGEEATGYHASGRSAALFEITYGHPTGVALSEAAMDYHANANGGVLSPRGFMVLGGADDRETFLDTTAKMRMDEVTMDDARSLFPILDSQAVTMAAYHAEAWDIDTELLMQNFIRDLRGNGGRVETRQQVTAIRREGAVWHVQAASGAEYSASTLVNAAGAWVDQVAKMAGVQPLGFSPLRRSMARLNAPGGLDVSGWPMVLGAGEDWYCKPDAGLLLVSPAEEDPVDPMDAWADDMVLAEGLARYEDMVTEPVTRPAATWAGLRTFAPDRALVIGPDPDEPAFFWVAGQGGSGFQTAPAASLLAADLLAGRPPEAGADIAAGLSPARFRG